MFRRSVLTLSAALVAGCLSFAPLASAADTITVFAAASLKNALDAVNEAYTAKTGVAVTTSYAASSALAKQIAEGAPADVFISADLAWMDDLAGKKLIVDATRSNLLGNELVLVAPKDQPAPVEIKPGFDLAGRIGEGRIAMGEVKAVPAGKYGKAALEKLGVWAAVEPKVASAENVRAALKLVSTGEAALGIVYKTDAAADAGVAVVGTFPADSHPPIVYPVAALANGKQPAATDYVTYLHSEDAKAIFTAQGFIIQP